MKRIAGIWFVVTLLVLSAAGASFAQEKSESSAEAKSPQPSSQETKLQLEHRPKVIQPYRLDFALNELEDGKKTNTRHYTMNLTAGSADGIKIGTRVPVPTGSGPGASFQYMDIGTDLWANLREENDELQLEVRSEISNLDLDSGPNRDASPLPIVRSMKMNGTTLLVTGKPMLIGSVDDPHSNRQFQLEVTATKLR